MATFNEKDVTLLYTGKSSATALTTGSIDALGDGEIGIFDASGTVRLDSSVAAGTDFRFVQGRGSAAPIVGKKILASSIKAVTIDAPELAVEQVAYVGYDGVTATSAIDVIPSNLYYIRAYVDQSLTSNHGGQYVKHAVYESPATGATQLSIAEGLISNGNLNMKREPEQFMRYDLVCDEAVVAANNFDGTLTVTAGSKTATASVLTYGGGTVPVVGDYVRISNDGTTVVDTASEVYKIVAIDGLNIVLDKPFLGASNVLGATFTEVIPALTVAAAQCGVKIQGRPLAWTLGKFNYRISKFDISLDDFGTTSFSNTFGTPGIGTYEQTAELEWFYRGNNGEYFRMGEPNIFPQILDVANESYAIVTIIVEEEGGFTTKNRRDMVYKLLIPSAVPVSPSTSGVTPCDWAKDTTIDGILNVLDIIAGSAVSATLV